MKTINQTNPDDTDWDNLIEEFKINTHELSWFSIKIKFKFKLCSRITVICVFYFQFQIEVAKNLFARFFFCGIVIFIGWDIVAFLLSYGPGYSYSLFVWIIMRGYMSIQLFCVESLKKIGSVWEKKPQLYISLIHFW